MSLSSSDTIPPKCLDHQEYDEEEFDVEFEDILRPPCPTKDERLPQAMSGIDSLPKEDSTRLHKERQAMCEPQAMCGVDKVAPTRLTGVVKWFNNKSGFGFITVCQENHPLHTKDVFCYYKSLRVVNYQFRYLIQGEYVDFTLVNAAVEPHEYQAVDVTGVQGGPLMCETRSMKTEADSAPFLAKSRYHVSTVEKGTGKGKLPQTPHIPSYHAKGSARDKPVRTFLSPPPLSQKRVQSAPRKKPILPDEDGFTRVDRHHHPRQNRVVNES